MIIRIVKMTFEPSKTEEFQELFQRNKEKIRGFHGCEFLEFYRDKNNKNIFFTYSYWQDEDALENYRLSPLFKKVWSETKQMFAGKPEAWSVDKVWSSGSVGGAQ
ncbi:putative quinol monooxygenase [Salinimicrobium terrae]|uniref:putative quinol monooxygenase n=1 Tax=Salinimicrobium terrae TaxID=470866 RepID=UPI00049155C3|nr:putative quinol monooxygenase [Salinimicrobium terrae]